MSEPLKQIFPACCRLLPEPFWQQQAEQTDPENFPERVRAYSAAAAYLPDLARAEFARYRLQRQIQAHIEVETLQINPTLDLVPVDWHPLLPLFDGNTLTPESESRVLVFWRHPRTGKNRQAVADAADLLALKIVAEQLDPRDIAGETDRPVGVIDAALEKAINKGLLLAPPSRLRRDTSRFPVPPWATEKHLQAEVFTLQWHITHRCDLHCRHCYDRSLRDDVDLAQGIKVLDQLRDFCVDRQVSGQISFSGGNPFLHPQFLQLYQAAKDRNFSLAVLGNPVSEAQLDEVLQIAKPSFYQVSLEGLQQHNDLIRGTGNFDSVLNFLDLLKRRKIYSMVMLTLTRANLGQVLPLAEILRDKVDLFTYNRLSMVGEGANLETPQADEYRAFVLEYLRARENNPAMALKDSLINIERDQQKQGLFGGCTGYGCGAAFNFFSLLPDGQVHACRKFPSLIGDSNDQTLADIYDSAEAAAYRQGCEECAPCHIRPVCGGCLAVAYGWGVDPLKIKDPGCFMT